MIIDLFKEHISIHDDCLIKADEVASMDVLLLAVACFYLLGVDI